MFDEVDLGHKSMLAENIEEVHLRQLWWEVGDTHRAVRCPGEKLLVIYSGHGTRSVDSLTVTAGVVMSVRSDGRNRCGGSAFGCEGLNGDAEEILIFIFV